MIAEVAVLRMGERLFHYSIPESLGGRVEPGMRVLVPFRSDWVTGIVTRRLSESPVRPLRSILKVLDREPLLDRPMMALARWVSDYYLSGWAAAIKAVLPSGMEVPVRRRFRLTEKGRAAGTERKGRTGPLIEALSLARRGRSLETLLRRFRKKGETPAAFLRWLTGLQRRGVLEELREVNPPKAMGASPIAPDRARPGPSFVVDSNPDSKEMIQAVQARRFSPFFFQGNREEVRGALIPAVSEAVRQGRSALILVPEIDRIGEWTERLSAAGLDPVGVLHGGLSDRERQAQWALIRSGGARVVAGTRLAVFAPAADPGLIIVEDEHDAAYKQEESPRYHARDVAVLRASHQEACVVMTGPYPSMETHANIQKGKYRALHPESNPAPSPRPSVRIIDRSGLKPGRILTEELEAEVAARLEKKNPVVLIINQRGFGGALYCPECGFVARCERCGVAMAFFKRKGCLCCPYCGRNAEPPERCAQCRGSRLRLVGFGTERVEDELKRRFPSARIARLDRDTGGAREAVLRSKELGAGELDLLVGTQLILRGPRPARPVLVGLLDADGAFHHPDFRAGEETFFRIARLLEFSGEGELIIQTSHPTHPGIAWARTGRTTDFYLSEMEQRRALSYPPSTGLAVVTIKAGTDAAASGAAARLYDRLTRSVPKRTGGDSGNDPALEILGPSPSVRPRLRGKYRWQILIKSPDRPMLHRLLRPAMEAGRSDPGPGRVEFEVDVDPLRVA